MGLHIFQPQGESTTILVSWLWTPCHRSTCESTVWIDFTFEVNPVKIIYYSLNFSFYKSCGRALTQIERTSQMKLLVEKKVTCQSFGHPLALVNTMQDKMKLNANIVGKYLQLQRKLKLFVPSLEPQSCNTVWGVHGQGKRTETHSLTSCTFHMQQSVTQSLLMSLHTQEKSYFPHPYEWLCLPFGLYALALEWLRIMGHGKCLQ